MLRFNRRQSLTWTLAACAGVPGVVRAQSAGVEVVMSGQGAVYAEVESVLRRELGAGVRSVSTQVQPATAGPIPTAVASVGLQALRQALNRSTQPGWEQVPILAGLLPQAAYALHAKDLPPGSSAVWLDQPTGRWLHLVREAFPKARKVGCLFGPTSSSQQATLRRLADASGVEMVAGAPIGQPQAIFPALSQVLDQAEVMLALPDPLVFNAETLQNILIATYRQRVPLVSYSEAHVKAGATLGLFTTPTQVAQQMVAALRQRLAGQALPAPQPASLFTVAVNDQVAQSLGLAVPDPSTLTQAMRRREGNP